MGHPQERERGPGRLSVAHPPVRRSGCRVPLRAGRGGRGRRRARVGHPVRRAGGRARPRGRALQLRVDHGQVRPHRPRPGAAGADRPRRRRRRRHRRRPGGPGPEGDRLRLRPGARGGRPREDPAGDADVRRAVRLVPGPGGRWLVAPRGADPRRVRRAPPGGRRLGVRPRRRGPGHRAHLRGAHVGGIGRGGGPRSPAAREDHPGLPRGERRPVRAGRGPGLRGGARRRPRAGDRHGHAADPPRGGVRAPAQRAGLGRPPRPPARGRRRGLPGPPARPVVRRHRGHRDAPRTAPLVRIRPRARPVPGQRPRSGRRRGAGRRAVRPRRVVAGLVGGAARPGPRRRRRPRVRDGGRRHPVRTRPGLRARAGRGADRGRAGRHLVPRRGASRVRRDRGAGPGRGDRHRDHDAAGADHDRAGRPHDRLRPGAAAAGRLRARRRPRRPVPRDRSRALSRIPPPTRGSGPSSRSRGGTRLSWLEPDGKRLLAARALRTFGYGYLAVVLGLYLQQLGLSAFEVGLVLTAAVAGSALMNVSWAVLADRFGRRRTVATMAVLMIAGGLLFTFTDRLGLLVLGALTGTISASSAEVGPFVTVEQAILPQTAPADRRTWLFSIYDALGTLAGAAGALCTGAVGLFARLGLAGAAAYRPLFLLYAAIGLGNLVLFRGLSYRVEAARVEGARRCIGLHRSRGTVAGLSALFGLDALAGGFVLQSIVAYWFHLRWGLSPAALGLLFFWVGVLS